MSDDRIAEILGEWLGTAERPDPQDVVARHPELADELQTRFRAMELVDQLLSRPEEGVVPERPDRSTPWSHPCADGAWRRRCDR